VTFMVPLRMPLELKPAHAGLAVHAASSVGMSLVFILPAGMGKGRGREGGGEGGRMKGGVL
jgi:hypothetical protein